MPPVLCVFVPPKTLYSLFWNTCFRKCVYAYNRRTVLPPVLHGYYIDFLQH